MTNLDIKSLAQSYAGGASPIDVVNAVYAKCLAAPVVFTYLMPLDQLLHRCDELQQQAPDARGPLWGVPFAVKDNIDVAGTPTTAACPAFEYIPKESAPAVQALLDAGGLMVGKTNMDQFASGLVGTRSPYGTPGSSSGSAVAIGSSLVSFALGTDTAGSGRVPAGLNGCVGIKPTVGSISTVGVVPACASLDCISVFARSTADGALVAAIMRKGDAGPLDSWRRTPPPALPPAATFRFAVPSEEFLDWSGPGGRVAAECYSSLFAQAVSRLQALGGSLVQDFDFAPLAKAAAALYGGAFVAERYSGIRAFLEKGDLSQACPAGCPPLERQSVVLNDERLLLVTRTIIAGASKFTAADLFDDMAGMAALRAQARHQLTKVDVLLVPTALGNYTQDELGRQEDSAPVSWPLNAKLGRFTNFVNLLDMCGVAVPSGMLKYEAGQPPEDAPEEVKLRASFLAQHSHTSVAVPFGVTLLAPAWRDEWLAELGGRLHEASGLGCGPEGHGVEAIKGPLLRPGTAPCKGY